MTRTSTARPASTTAATAGSDLRLVDSGRGGTPEAFRPARCPRVPSEENKGRSRSAHTRSTRRRLTDRREIFAFHCDHRTEGIPSTPEKLRAAREQSPAKCPGGHFRNSLPGPAVMVRPAPTESFFSQRAISGPVPGDVSTSTPRMPGPRRGCRSSPVTRPHRNARSSLRLRSQGRPATASRRPCSACPSAC